MVEMVNHPKHYNSNGIETKDIIKSLLGNEGYKYFCLGNIIKYLDRCEFKNSKEQDLEKSRWYSKDYSSVEGKDLAPTLKGILCSLEDGNYTQALEEFLLIREQETNKIQKNKQEKEEAVLNEVLDIIRLQVDLFNSIGCHENYQDIVLKLLSSFSKEMEKLLSEIKENNSQTNDFIPLEKVLDNYLTLAISKDMEEVFPPAIEGVMRLRVNRELLKSNCMDNFSSVEELVMSEIEEQIKELKKRYPRLDRDEQNIEMKKICLFERLLNKEESE